MLEGIDVEIPDYKNEKQVIIDIVTLDSTACAACQYMVEAIKVACEEFGHKVKWIERSVKEKESVVFMLKSKVSNVPTALIDGEIKYISIIPDINKLKEDIRTALKAKGL